MENETSANSSIVPASGASVGYANTNDVVGATSNNELVAAVAPPPMQQQAQPQQPQHVLVFYPFI
ncbi:OLC1v1016121C1 [Oldenlandia corymbosa var. corymbosa]|uniref:OLC1v1016121C1 n=1 Tax=Oldenlandia corymbosa var. corymbosa TaxID=529605 RepID=A0AAV1E4Q6_OLDCO|nr:OLC1v1016121C1 [Oldenlandia corymbosa var. corymbosa]